MRIKDIGEFGLIERISSLLPPYKKDVAMGVGDDAAVLELNNESYLLATCDIQVEGIHFQSHFITPYQLGRRAAAINISDIAAKGGFPTHFLVSLAIPPECEVSWVDELYRGIGEEASRYGADVVGGNLSRIDGPAMVDLFLLGKVKKGDLLLRSGAKPGDIVLVTGNLGDAAAGLQLLLNKDISSKLHPEDRAYLVGRYLTPVPRLEIGQLIGQFREASAMIDLSDGLASDVAHICRMSGVGVKIWTDQLPISPEARKVAKLLGLEEWALALRGGEDYELCFIAPREQSRVLLERIKEKAEVPVTEVGEILSEKEGKRLVLEDGRVVSLEARGWDHFQCR